MSVTHDLAEHLSSIAYEAIPDAVIQDTKIKVLDTIAATVAGSSADGVKELVRLAKGWGGKKECTIPVFGGKLPAHSAALVNCTMARARDLDDIHEPARSHVHVATVPCGLIFSEYSRKYRNKPVSGRDYLLAVILASDLICRLRTAGGKMALEGGWCSETLVAVPLAALGGRILCFDQTTLLNAMGIGYAQIAGNLQANYEGALTVRLQQGFSAQAGVLSAILAERGFTGASGFLEGKAGLYSLYMRDTFIAQELTAGLGKRFEGLYSSIKLYPCCRCTHRAIQGALELVLEHHIEPDNISAVTLFTNTTDTILLGGECKIAPRTVPEAQFSYYYTVATAIVKGKVYIDDFTEKAIKDPRVLAMCKKIEIVVDPEKDKLKQVGSLIDIQIETKDGHSHKKTVEFLKGHPEYPLTMQEVRNKLESSVEFSARPIAAANIRKLEELVNDLEELDDVAVLMEYLH